MTGPQRKIEDYQNNLFKSNPEKARLSEGFFGQGEGVNLTQAANMIPKDKARPKNAPGNIIIPPSANVVNIPPPVQKEQSIIDSDVIPPAPVSRRSITEIVKELRIEIEALSDEGTEVIFYDNVNQCPVHNWSVRVQEFKEL